MYKTLKEKSEEENEKLKKEKLKIYENIQWITKYLIENKICNQYKDYQSFSKQYCIYQCINKANCEGYDKIRLEEEKFSLINKVTKNNQDYINRDNFFN